MSELTQCEVGGGRRVDYPFRGLSWYALILGSLIECGAAGRPLVTLAAGLLVRRGRIKAHACASVGLVMTVHRSCVQPPLSHHFLNSYKLLARAYPYMAKRLLTDPAAELRGSFEELVFQVGCSKLFRAGTAAGVALLTISWLTPSQTAQYLPIEIPTGQPLPLEPACEPAARGLQEPGL